MTLLLDTHILIWGVASPERLHPRVASALVDPKSELWYSPINVWEICALSRKRKANLPEAGRIDSWLRQAIGGLGCREAVFTSEIALASEGLALSHWDPADRFLAATAKVLGLTLVTADERLLASTDYATLSNR